MAAPPRVFGETLAHEHSQEAITSILAAGPIAVLAPYVPNGEMRLFGGAQERALGFRAVVSSVKCPPISREDIINSCGVDEVHDGVNYTRTACVIAVARAKEIFEPYVHQLGFRLAHVARRLLPVAMYLLQEGRILTGHEAFLKRIGACFAAFVDQKVKACREKCREDLQSTVQLRSRDSSSAHRAGVESVLGPERSRARDAEARDVGATFDDHHGYPDEPHAHRDERDRDHRRRHRDD